MKETEETLPASNEKSSLANMESSSRETEVSRLKELIAELKGNIVVLNRGIVLRQDTVEQLTKRKQELLEADKHRAVRITRQGVVEDEVSAREAIEIFPEEIWEMILGNLSDPSDLRNCSRSCQLFDKILHPLKPNFLFIGIFPDLCSYLENAIILRCRRVCKGWNEGVDSFLDNHPQRTPIDKKGWNPLNPLPTTNGLFHLDLSNRRSVLQDGMNLMHEMRHHTRNPLVGRTVTIRISVQHTEKGYSTSASHSSEDEEDDLERVEPVSQLFWQALLNFLGTVGSHIWYLSFQVDEKAFIVGESCLFGFLTGELFTLVPNLRGILTNGYLPSRPTDEVPRMKSTELPLPFIPHLETLQFINDWSDRELVERDVVYEGSVIETLIRISCLQLKKLKVEWAHWKHMFNFNLEWPNLTEIYINSDGLRSIIDAKHLLPSRMPRLRKLGLSNMNVDLVDGVESERELDFQEIMKIIIGLSANTNLHVLHLNGRIGREQVLQAPMQLVANPNLKTLEIHRPITLYTGRTRYDYDTKTLTRVQMSRGDYTFLLRFPFLENLVIFCDEGDDLRNDEGHLERQIVELEPYMSEGRLYDCEIWECLPRLKSLRIQVGNTTAGRYRNASSSLYTKECYEQTTKKRLEMES